MNTSALYNLYTEDYSVDSIRKAPVTIKELIRQGVSAEDANLFLALSEKLYSSFLQDTLTGAHESEATVSIWNQLRTHCLANNIADDGIAPSFCLYGFDVALNNGTVLIPREKDMFRMCLEQKLAQVCLMERKLEREYGLLFTVSEDDYWRVVRFNKETKSLDDVPNTELQSIISRIRIRHQKNAKLLDSKSVSDQISFLSSNIKAQKELLEKECLLVDEQDELESLEFRIQEILNQPPVHILSRKDLLWVFMGTDTCSENKHHVMEIRAQFEFYNGNHKRYLIRRCAHCKQYQIDFEQLESIWKEYKSIPKVELIYVGSNGVIYDTYWKDRSIFSDHGYSVSQKMGLTAVQRQQKLKWIIDHGIMNKYDTIRFLRSRINVNGAKSENWLARSKWEEDLRYVQSL